MIRLPAIAALTTALVLVACSEDSSAETQTLVFSAIPDHDQTNLAKYEKVAKYLTDKLGVEVRYQGTADYDATVEQFTNGDVQLAWFGGLTGVKARHAVPGARAIAQGESDPNFYSYFIAHKDAGLERSDEFPRDIAGKKFTFGSKGSTSGRLMPEYFIRENTGKAPDEVFETVGFADTHDATCEQVESGAYQIGAVNYATYDKRVADGKTDPEVCKIIWKTPTYPDYNLTAHPAIDQMFGDGFTDRIQKVFIEIDDPELLSIFERKKMIIANNEDFEPIAKLAEQLGFLRQ